MIRCRKATLPELRQILDWAAVEGWNPGLDDAEAFYHADPDGFYVATDEADRPVATISVVNHNAEFAFLGLYIVSPEFRGKGIGMALWEHALRHTGNRTVGLDGVEAQQKNYEASGFKHAGATTRFEGAIQGKRDPVIRLAQSDDLPALIAKEVSASGVAKPAYLRAWFASSETRQTIVSDGTAAMDGFCTIRACRNGAKIGPLVANDASVSQRLVAHAATLFEGPVILDVPQTASDLTRLCAHHGLMPGFRTARMYRGPISRFVHRNYAVTSLELG